jgi:hypothetical protein
MQKELDGEISLKKFQFFNDKILFCHSERSVAESNNLLLIIASFVANSKNYGYHRQIPAYRQAGFDCVRVRTPLRMTSFFYLTFSMPNPLSQNILATIAYYDVSDYPLTVFELWKYLISDQQSVNNNQKKDKVALIDIINELENEDLKKQIETFRGYYFLPGRKNLVAQRIGRNKISEEKYKIIRRVVQFLRFVPFVRMILVTGRVAMKNAARESDLDLLVCLEKGRIFTGRTLVTLAIHLLGKRRYGKKITNRVCLNYFITTHSLEIEMQDLFASSEYFFALPLFGFDYFQEFQRANSWILKYHENYFPAKIPSLKIISDNYFSKSIRSAGEKIFNFNFLEQKLKAWQTKRIALDSRTNMPGSMIVADDNSLVFLPEPQGPKVFEAFKMRMEKLGEKQ